MDKKGDLFVAVSIFAVCNLTDFGGFFNITNNTIVSGFYQ